MGFLSQSYKQQLLDQEKKSTPQKSSGGKSIASKISSGAGAVARAVGGNTARFINQGVQEGKQAVETGRMLTAQATDNPEAFSAANKRSQQDYKGFKTSGGLFNAGTITNEQESKQGAAATGIKKIGAGTVGTAAEIVPFARGATLAKEGGSIGSNLFRAGLEGAGYGALGQATDAVRQDQGINLKDEVKGALLGGASGGIGFGLGKGVGAVAERLHGKPVQEATQNVLDTNQLDELTPKKIPVTGGDEVATVGKVGAGLPISNRVQFTPEKNIPFDDTTFRARFNNGAKDVAKKVPAVANEYLKTGSKDATDLLLNHLSAGKSNTNVGKIVDTLIPELGAKESKTLTNQIANSTDRNKIKSLLFDASENQRRSSEVGNEVTKPSTKITFGNAATATGTKAKQAVSALTSDTSRDTAIQGSVDAGLDANGNYTSGPLRGQPPLTNFEDTRATTPDRARGAVALEATKPGAAIEQAVDQPARAKQALMGVEAPKVENAGTQVAKGAENIAKRLDDQLSTFGKEYAAPDGVLKAISRNNLATAPARSHDFLNKYEDTLGVLGRHFGKVGTDIGYKLAEGAKRVSDIQDAARESVDTATKLLNKAAKSKAGRSDIQSRVYSALEHRDDAGFNVSDYLPNQNEQKIFDATSNVFDFFKNQREKLGKSVVGENYSPRAAVSNALEAPSRLLQDARSAFSTDVKSRFSKERVAQIPDAEINKNIIDLLPQYVSSQAKEFGYEGAMQFTKDNLPNVNPAYLTDNKSRRQGEEYLRKLFSQVLDPASVSKSEQFQNKLIGNTYRAQLGLSPKFAFQNLTQRFATRAAVSKEAIKLSKVLDKSDIDTLRKGMTSGSNPITGEATATAEGLNSKQGVFSKIDPGMRVEKGNVIGAFDKGASQAIVDSQPYKDALKQGMQPRDAAKLALKDPEVQDLATRHGNTVVNDTQFGANFVTKPEFFRESGTWFGLSDKWYKQYQRFPQGMIQNMSTILRAHDARALDILKRGNPTETPLVDYLKSAQALHNGVDDLITGIKNGEVSDVSMEVAQGYKKSLGKATDELNKQIKSVSQIRGGKTAKNVAKMWAAASAIQFLFDGGLSMQGDAQSKEISKSLRYGSPISVPTKDQNPLIGAMIPSSPLGTQGFNGRKAANLIPGVGIAVSRGNDIMKFVKAITGQQ